MSTENPPAQNNPVAQASDAEPISGKQVAEFLRHHPDWLFKQDQLVGMLDLRSKEHGSTSLLEHQTQTLRKANQAFKRSLSQLTSHAKKNQELVESLFQFCVQLMGTNNLTDIYNILQHGLIELFDIEFAQLILLTATPPEGFRVESIDDHRANQARLDLLLAPLPVCVDLNHDQCEFLFGTEQASQLASSALIPIRVGQQPHALCCLGSRDAQRYHRDKETDFLVYIQQLVVASLRRVIYQ